MTPLERIWSTKTDAQVRAAASAASDYEPEAQSVIRAEFERRNLGSGQIVDLDSEGAYIDTLGLASPRRRIAARLIDGCVANLPLIVLAMSMEETSLQMTAEMSVAASWSIGYHLLGDTIPGGSVGKRFLRLDVVDMETRKPCTPTRSVIRRLPEVIPLLNFVDALFLFKPKRQRLADLLLGTIVVRRPDPVSVDAPERP